MPHAFLIGQRRDYLIFIRVKLTFSNKRSSFYKCKTYQSKCPAEKRDKESIQHIHVDLKKPLPLQIVNSLIFWITVWSYCRSMFHSTIALLIKPMTCPKVTSHKDLLSLSPPVWAADSNTYVNASGSACLLPALNSVSFQAGGVWGVSNCTLCQQAPRDDQTALDYIHIGVCALWASKCVDVSECH